MPICKYSQLHKQAAATKDQILAVSKKLGKSPEEITQLTSEVDPTKKYEVWLLKQMAFQNIRLPEDVERVQQTLQKFEQLNLHKQLQFQNINQYKTIMELEVEIKNKIPKELGENYDYRLQEYMKLPGVELYGQNSEYLILEVSDPESLTELGQETGWCTKHLQHAEYYLVKKGNKQYVVFKKENGKYVKFAQFAEDFSQFKNVDDHEMKEVDDSLFQLATSKLEAPFSFVKRNGKAFSEHVKNIFSNQSFFEKGEANLIYNQEGWFVVQPLSEKAIQYYVFDERMKNSFSYYDLKRATFLLIYNTLNYEEDLDQFLCWQYGDLNEDAVTYGREQQENMSAFEFKQKYPKLVEKIQARMFNPENYLKLQQVFSNEIGIGLRIKDITEIVEEHHKYSTASFIQKIMEGEHFFDLEYPDLNYLSQYYEINPEHLKGIQGYFIKKYPQEDLSAIDWNNSEEVYTLIEEYSEEDLEEALRKAYAYAQEDALYSKILGAARDELTEHFGVDFSRWYPGEVVYVPEVKVKEHWDIFNDKNPVLLQKDGESLLKGLVEEPLNERDLHFAVEKAENQSYVTRESYNQFLSETLGEII